MSRNTKIAITSITGFIFFAVLVFMIVSLSLASAHNNSLIDEWKSWNGEEVVEEADDENSEDTNEDIEETVLNVTSTNIDDYSLIEIVA